MYNLIVNYNPIIHYFIAFVNTFVRTVWNFTTTVFIFYLQECQSLIEDNRRLMSLTGGGGGGVSRNGGGVDPLGCGSDNTVETVVLQTQIDTLQWQLKQVHLQIEMIDYLLT